MKWLQTLLFCTLTWQICLANMSSPFRGGTMGVFAVTSNDMDILHEKITVVLGADKYKAHFIVEYTIRSKVEGRQIPLLFIADRYSGGFTVLCDNDIVALKDVSQYYEGHAISGNFSNAIIPNHKDSNATEVIVGGTKDDPNTRHLKDMKYFEIDLTAGEHIIKVEYDADNWTDLSGWVIKYGFDYDMSPARFWRSFGTLTVTIRQEGPLRKYTTNLGSPQEDTIGSENTWTFDHLPADNFRIEFAPQASKFACILIAIDPFGLAIILSILLLILHCFWIIRYRRRHPDKKVSPVMIVGSIVVPLVFILSYMAFFDWIDYIIGEYASRRHGYTFLIAIFYPIILCIYLPIPWLVDVLYKRRLKKRSGT